ncbi:MAG: thiol reductant ABC exporter subunit CydD [Burkholderiaceae bacterium]|nr:thiol reductant ABC exporter subunit CydD [Burkholderiaceae bacterium]
MTVAMVAPVLAGVLLLVQAWLMAQLLGVAITAGLAPAQASYLIAAIVALMMLRAAISWVGERAASWAAENIKTQLRSTLFAYLLAQGPAATRHLVAGELSSTLVDQIDVLDGFFIRYLPSVIAAVFLPLAFGIVLLPVDWIVALLLLLTAPLIPVFMALIGLGAQAASQRHQTAMTRLSGYFADRMRGALTLKLFGRTDAEVGRVRQASLDLSQKTMVVLRLAFLSSAVLELFAALGVAGVAVYVGLSFLGYLGPTAGPSSLQAGLFCLLLAPEVYSPLRQFAANYHDRAAARAAMAQIQTLFGELPMVQKTENAGTCLAFADTGIATQHAAKRDRTRMASSGAADTVVFDVHRLVVMAGSHRLAVLRDVSLSIRQGQKIALMGSSGSGKTTLLEALTGMRAKAGGDVFYDGVPLLDKQILSLSDGLVLSSQQPFFMATTVADNLKLAAPMASDTQLWTALAQADMDAAIRALPLGLSTPLQAGGYGMSGGQLQRLALARVFLSQARVLLLDEPTAHLDGDSRDRVISALLAFSEGRTLLVATHDPAVAQRLDCIWRIQDQQVFT